jgi:hypothetical protein
MNKEYSLWTKCSVFNLVIFIVTNVSEGFDFVYINIFFIIYILF